MLIHSYSDEKDYLEKIILNYLQSKNLKVKVSKYKFLQKSISYFDYAISDKGIYPQQIRLKPYYK